MSVEGLSIAGLRVSVEGLGIAGLRFGVICHKLKSIELENAVLGISALRISKFCTLF